MAEADISVMPTTEKINFDTIPVPFRRRLPDKPK